MTKRAASNAAHLDTLRLCTMVPTRTQQAIELRKDSTRAVYRESWVSRCNTC